jgi:hypothetical protein
MPDDADSSILAVSIIPSRGELLFDVLPLEALGQRLCIEIMLVSSPDDATQVYG